MMSAPTGVVLAAIVLVLAVVALLPRAEVRHPLVVLIRVLVPSWRFFDGLQVTPAIRVRVARAGEDFGAWEPILAPAARRWWHVVWNPEGNLVLAQHALLERLLMDVGEWEGDAAAVTSLVSYDLVLDLVTSAIARDARFAGAARCQFKLVDQQPGAPDDLLISDEHDA
ncbi:MAG: hypothetical protein IT359_14510 [Gemmatimonadaceae bacterium]|nr:hypothetical protein [Gemmatimonadaceae bacterium]